MLASVRGRTDQHCWAASLWGPPGGDDDAISIARIVGIKSSLAGLSALALVVVLQSCVQSYCNLPLIGAIAGGSAGLFAAQAPRKQSRWWAQPKLKLNAARS